MRVAIELADKGIAVLLGPVGQRLDEVFNLFPVGLSKRLCAAEVDGVGLYQFGIEFVLADDLAETVPDLGATAIPVSIRVLGRKLLSRNRSCPDLLDRADADAVCEAFLSAGLMKYEKEGTRYVQRFLARQEHEP
jgi:hypothetical protein